MTSVLSSSTCDNNSEFLNSSLEVSSCDCTYYKIQLQLAEYVRMYIFLNMHIATYNTKKFPLKKFLLVALGT